MQPSNSFPSPSSRYRLDVAPKEVRMSHWVNCPYLFDNQTNVCIFHLGGWWDASEVEWSKEGEKLSMKLRHYADGSVTFRFVVDLAISTAELSASNYGVLSKGSIDGVVGELANTTQLRTIFY